MKSIRWFVSLALLTGSNLVHGATAEYLMIDNPIAASTVMRVTTGSIESPCKVTPLSNGEIRECRVAADSNTFEFEKDGQKSSGQFSTLQTISQRYDSMNRLESYYKGEMTLSGKKIKVEYTLIESTLTETGVTSKRASVRLGDKLSFDLH